MEMRMLITTIAAVAVGTVVATSAFAQGARDVPGAELLTDRLERGLEGRLRAREGIPQGGPADRRQLADELEG